MMFKTLLNWIWAPLVISAVAIVGLILEWPVEAVIPTIGGIFVIGLAVAIIGAREKESEKLSERLRHLAGYFHRRFMGESSLSIFAIINSLFKTDNTKLWEWARSCDAAQRVFNTWSESSIKRMEVDTKTGRFGIYLRAYLNELWQINNLYKEFVDQFQEIASKVEIPLETIEQYHKFISEYNAFVRNFCAFVSDSLKAGKTEIEPPSIKEAQEVLPIVKNVPKA